MQAFYESTMDFGWVRGNYTFFVKIPKYMPIHFFEIMKTKFLVCVGFTV